MLGQQGLGGVELHLGDEVLEFSQVDGMGAAGGAPDLNGLAAVVGVPLDGQEGGLEGDDDGGGGWRFHWPSVTVWPTADTSNCWPRRAWICTASASIRARRRIEPTEP